MKKRIRNISVLMSAPGCGLLLLLWVGSFYRGVCIRTRLTEAGYYCSIETSRGAVSFNWISEPPNLAEKSYMRLDLWEADDVYMVSPSLFKDGRGRMFGFEVLKHHNVGESTYTLWHFVAPLWFPVLITSILPVIWLIQWRKRADSPGFEVVTKSPAAE